MFLKNKNIIFKIRRSKVTDYAALIGVLSVYLLQYYVSVSSECSDETVGESKFYLPLRHLCLSVCFSLSVCVCVCARARARVCVCVCHIDLSLHSGTKIKHITKVMAPLKIQVNF